MRKLVIALSLTVALLAGCIIGATASRLVVPPVRAGTNPQKWQYSCVEITFEEAERVTKVANRYGAAGWEMAMVAGHGASRNDVWCFKRRLP